MAAMVGAIDAVGSRRVRGAGVMDVFAPGSILPAFLSDCQTGSGSAARGDVKQTMTSVTTRETASWIKEYLSVMEKKGSN